MIRVAPKQADVYSDYYGGSYGVPFNDRALIGNSNSIRITKLEVSSGSFIDYIRVSRILQYWTNHILMPFQGHIC